MSRTHTFSSLCVGIVSSMGIAFSAWAQDQEQGPVIDPCAELLAVDTSESSTEDDVTSKQLELSMSRLDECLDSLLFGIGGASGTGIGANTDSDGTNAPFTTFSQEGKDASDGNDTETLSGSLSDWDDFLDGLEIELDPLDASARPSNGGRVTSDSQSGQLEPEAQDTVTGKPQEESADNADLKGDKVENESRHTDSNRQPLDPKDEDAVLKQIREAAERETNPDTKEALWDTYYDYLDSKKRK